MKIEVKRILISIMVVIYLVTSISMITYASETEEVNVALGKSASGTANSSPNDAAKGNDGSINSIFVTDAGDGNTANWVVDLESRYLLSKIELTMRQDGVPADTDPTRNHFNVYGSNTSDYSDKVRLAYNANVIPAKGTWEISITNTNSFRYLIVDREGATNKRHLIFAEFRAFGVLDENPNIAFFKPTSASGFQSHSNPEQYSHKTANDGNVSSYWQSNADVPGLKAYWQVDLQAEYIINKIAIQAGELPSNVVYRREFRVIASNDPEFYNFTVLATEPGAYLQDSTWQKTVNIEEAFRYVRIEKYNPAVAAQIIYLALPEVIINGTIPLPPPETRVSLSKSGSDYKVNILDWRENYSYQIWAYEKMESGIFEGDISNETNQWVLKKKYTPGSGFDGDTDGSIKYTFTDFESVDKRYTIVLRVKDPSGTLVANIRDTYTPTDIGEVVINNVMIDGKVASNSAFIKDIAANNGKVEIKVTGNGVSGTEYGLTANPGNINIPIKSGSTDTFDWDISTLEPGKYTIIAKAFTVDSFDTLNIDFNLYKVDPEVIYGKLNDVGVNGNVSGTDFEISLTPEIVSGAKFDYKISEPWRTAISGNTEMDAPTSGTTITDKRIKANEYGIYQITSYIRRATGLSADDGIIKNVVNKRPGAQSLNVDINGSLYSGGEYASTKGVSLTIAASGSFDGVNSGDVEYSYWRRDAKGWILIRDYNNQGQVTWTPARVGLYTIQVRAKGPGAKSYELIKNLEFDISDDVDTKAVVSNIAINSEELVDAKARTPILLSATVQSDDSALLYKYIISNSFIYYIETQYSPDPDYNWIPGKAGEYKISVLVKSRSSFGKFDVIETFTLQIEE